MLSEEESSDRYNSLSQHVFKTLKQSICSGKICFSPRSAEAALVAPQLVFAAGAEHKQALRSPLRRIQGDLVIIPHN